MKKLIGLIIIVGCFAQDTSKLDVHIAKAEHAFAKALEDNTSMFNARQKDLQEAMNVWVRTRNETARIGKISKVEAEQWEAVKKAMVALNETGMEWVLVMEKFQILVEEMKSEQ